MANQLINEATYNALTTIPVEARPAEMQEQIEEYEAANNLNVDAEEHAPEATVEPKTQVTFVDPADDESEASVAFIDTVEQDPSIAAQMTQSLAVLDKQLSIKDTRYKSFLALAAKATCLVKWTGPFILDLRVGDSLFANYNIS